MILLVYYLPILNQSKNLSFPSSLEILNQYHSSPHLFPRSSIQSFRDCCKPHLKHHHFCQWTMIVDHIYFELNSLFRSDANRNILGLGIHNFLRNECNIWWFHMKLWVVSIPLWVHLVPKISKKYTMMAVEASTSLW